MQEWYMFLNSGLFVHLLSKPFLQQARQKTFQDLWAIIVFTEIFHSSKKAAKDDIQMNTCQKTLVLLLVLQPTATITNTQNSYFSFPNISKEPTLGVCGQNQSDPQVHFVITTVPTVFTPLTERNRQTEEFDKRGLCYPSTLFSESHHFSLTLSSHI